MEGRGSVRRAALEETRGEEGPRGGRRKRRGGEGKEGEGKGAGKGKGMGEARSPWGAELPRPEPRSRRKW